MGKIKPWGKPPKPVPEYTRKVMTCYGYKVRPKDCVKLADDHRRPNPLTIRFILHNGNALTLKPSYEYLRRYLYEREDRITVSEDDLRASPYYDKGFPAEYELEQKLKLARPLKPADGRSSNIECPICGKTFVSEMALAGHSRIHKTAEQDKKS